MTVADLTQLRFRFSERGSFSGRENNGRLATCIGEDLEGKKCLFVESGLAAAAGDAFAAVKVSVDSVGGEETSRKV